MSSRCFLIVSFGHDFHFCLILDFFDNNVRFFILMMIVKAKVFKITFALTNFLDFGHATTVYG